MGAGASTSDESYVFRQFKGKYVSRIGNDCDSGDFYAKWNDFVAAKQAAGNYEDFCPVVQAPTIETYRNDINALFEALDRDGGGVLTASELSGLVDASSRAQVQGQLNQMDIGGDGSVSRAELSAFLDSFIALALKSGDVFSFELLLANAILFAREGAGLRNKIADTWASVAAQLDATGVSTSFDKYEMIEKLQDPEAIDMFADVETTDGGKIGAAQWAFFWANNSDSAAENMDKINGWLAEQQKAAQILQSKARMRKAKQEVEAKREQQEQSKAALLIQGKSRQRDARKKVAAKKASASG